MSRRHSRWLPDESGGAVDATVLPRLASPAPSPESEPAAKRELIVLADDNADMRQYLRHLLGDRYQVHSVADGCQALEATRQLRPALVLADVMMPGLDGFGLLRAMRDDSVVASTLSARAGEESRVEGLQSGADDYLIKPFTARELLARVATHVKMARLRRETAEREERLSASEERLAETSRLYRELQDREAKIRRLVDANIVGVLITNVEGQIVEANDAFLQMVRYTHEDLKAGRLRWTELTPPEWQAVSERAVVQLKATGTCEIFEKEYFRSDGTRVSVLVAAAAIEETKTEVVAFVLDLTERKQAEQERERLRHLQADLAYISRVNAMGELAASLAHEIKQPIAAAATNARTGLRWLQREPAEIAEARESLTRILKDVNRAADIVDRNRALYRQDRPKRESVDLNELIREISALLYDKANQHSISIRTELNANLPPINADRVQLQQVLMNLMLNGIEAMKDTSGHLTVMSKRTEDSELLVSVSDSGIGLPVEDSERIFDAFFTTKPQGTGMGLSISRRIIESHGGRLWASANPGRGATFQFTLPTEIKASSTSAA